MRGIFLKLATAALVTSVACGIAFCTPRSLTLRNSQLTAQFGDRGLSSLEDRALNKKIALAGDTFSLTIDGHEISSDPLKDPAVKTDATSVRYVFDAPPYQIEVVYSLSPGWRFVSKRLIVNTASKREFHVDRIEVFDARLSDTTGSAYVAASRWVKPGTPGRNYGIFERFPDRSGLFALVQNPFLTVEHAAGSFSISYSPGNDLEAGLWPIQIRSWMRRNLPTQRADGARHGGR